MPPIRLIMTRTVVLTEGQWMNAQDVDEQLSRVVRELTEYIQVERQFICELQMQMVPLVGARVLVHYIAIGRGY